MINSYSALAYQACSKQIYEFIQTLFDKMLSSLAPPEAQFFAHREVLAKKPKLSQKNSSWTSVATAAALFASLLLSCISLADQSTITSTKELTAADEKLGKSPGGDTKLTSGNQVAVGVVSMALGRGYIERGIEQEKVVAGLPVNVGDRLYTEAGGHIHVRFVDDALVSVRPMSTLQVVLYDYDAENPAKSSVKFELTEGVARAISGDAAKSARQRFRLNTPIAAIGVRGTDFVVSADSRTTAALVNEGAIVMAPLSVDCSSDSLGPCSSGAVELGQNNIQLLGLDEISKAPRILAMSTEGDSAETAAAYLGAENSRTRDSSYAEVDIGSRKESNSESNDVFLETAANAQINNEETIAISVDYTPRVALTANEADTSQLVWGRWSDNSSPLGNLLSLSTQEARVNREVTISTPAGFILYRNQTDEVRISENYGRIAFDLNKAEAFHNSSDGSVPMVVKGGSLELDFVEKSFSTALALFHGSLGAVDLEANGQIADGGYLRLNSSTQSLSGAVSNDGTEAAYLFEQTLNDANVTGLTLWGAK